MKPVKIVSSMGMLCQMLAIAPASDKIDYRRTICWKKLCSQSFRGYFLRGVCNEMHRRRLALVNSNWGWAHCGPWFRRYNRIACQVVLVSNMEKYPGIHSIERSAQEDMLLVLFNVALSNLVLIYFIETIPKSANWSIFKVLFRNNFAFSRDIAGTCW